MKATDYEIVNHGYDHCQYFQGCGTYGTPFDMVFSLAAPTMPKKPMRTLLNKLTPTAA